MRKVLTFFIIIILTIIQTKNSISHEINKNQIDEIIREFIINNPNVLEKSILNYKESKAKKKFLSILNELKKVSNPKIHHKDKNLTIYEFFDYNCGYCKTMMNRLFETYERDKNFSIVFVELPILSQSSFDASIAALAAHNQNRYIEYHIELMKHQGNLNKGTLIMIAKKLNLDLKLFQDDLSNDRLRVTINKNRKIAQKLKLRGTPAFIIGNTIYPGALKKSDLMEAIKLERINLKK
tara:strand:- start:2669 stop:3382 length:714 start_codon:yes stop_codon:yes gene_type:complete